jgi:hypothetical protein
VNGENVVKEIYSILERNALAMALIFVLWIILSDQKAIIRINNKPIIKRGAYLAIIIYYSLIIIEIIRIIPRG